MNSPVPLVISAILTAMQYGPQIIAAWQNGEITEEEAEAKWDTIVAPGWGQAYRNWKDAGET